MKQDLSDSAVVEAAFENAGEALFILDSDGHVLKSNRSARTMLGGAGSIDVTNIHDRLHLAFGSTTPLPVRFDIDGRDYTLSARRLAGAAPPCILVSAAPHKKAVRHYADLNERLAAINAVAAERQKRRSLEASYADLDRFAGIAAHDLNAPLRQIALLLSMMRADMADRLRSEDLQRFQQIEQRAVRLRRLVTALLDYARAANAPLQVAPLRLEEVMAGIRDDLTPFLEKTGGAVTIGSLPVVDGDPALTPQLFQNLISNSVQYHRENVPPEVAITCQETPQSYLVSVCDNGVGVDEKYLKRIFDPFMRIDATKDVGGVGIGLSIVRMVVVKHRWKVEFASSPGEGSTATVCIPKNNG